MLPAGQLTERVTILAPVATRDPITGQELPTWSPIKTLWATITTQGGQELTSGNRQLAVAQTTATMRRMLGLTTRHQLEHRGRRYNILAIDMPEGPNGPAQVLTLTANPDAPYPPAPEDDNEPPDEEPGDDDEPEEDED